MTLRGRLRQLEAAQRPGIDPAHREHVLAHAFAGGAGLAIYGDERWTRADWERRERGPGRTPTALHWPPSTVGPPVKVYLADEGFDPDTA